MTEKDRKRFKTLSNKIMNGFATKLEEKEFNEIGERRLESLKEAKKNHVIETHWDVDELKKTRNY